MRAEGFAKDNTDQGGFDKKEVIRDRLELFGLIVSMCGIL